MEHARPAVEDASSERRSLNSSIFCLASMRRAELVEKVLEVEEVGISLASAAVATSIKSANPKVIFLKYFIVWYRIYDTTY